MVGRTVLATLAGTKPHQRLQVALTQRGEGRVLIDLREQHYAEGIGWFDQRTMELDPKQFRQLQAILGLKGAEDVAGRPVSGSGIDHEAPTTIPFPGPWEREPSRPAVGDEG
jgi:hypothetical protein